MGAWISHNLKVDGRTQHCIDRVTGSVETLSNSFNNGTGLNSDNLATVRALSGDMRQTWVYTLDKINEMKQRRLLHPDDVKSVNDAFLEVRNYSVQLSRQASVLVRDIERGFAGGMNQAARSAAELAQSVEGNLTNVVRDLEDATKDIVVCTSQAFNGVVANFTDCIAWLWLALMTTTVTGFFLCSLIHNFLHPGYPFHEAYDSLVVYSTYSAMASTGPLCAALLATGALGLFLIQSKKCLRRNDMQPHLQNLPRLQAVAAPVQQRVSQPQLPSVPVGSIVAHHGVVQEIQWEYPFYVPGTQQRWLYCFGQELDFEMFPELFNVIQTSALHNVQGATVVRRSRVPDLRGTFLRGCDGPKVREGTLPDSAHEICDKDLASRTGNPAYYSGTDPCSHDYTGTVQHSAMRAHKHKLWWPHSEYYAHTHDGQSLVPVEGPSYEPRENPTRFNCRDAIWCGAREYSMKGDYWADRFMEAQDGGPVSQHETRPHNTAVHWIICARS